MKGSGLLVQKIAIQAAIFLALVALIEGASRILERINPPQEFKQQLGLQSYMMFASGPSHGVIWQDILKNKKVHSTLEFNNYGFRNCSITNSFPTQTTCIGTARSPMNGSFSSLEDRSSTEQAQQATRLQSRHD